MKKNHSLLALLGGVLLLPPALAAAPTTTAPGASDKDILTAELRHKSYPKWDFVLPKETWTTVSDRIPLPGSDSSAYQVAKRGPLKIEVDSTGNGRFDSKVKGMGGSLTLRGRDEEGESFQYAVRFKSSSSAWRWSAGGAMRGKLGGHTILIIDQNNNGLYNDYGQDAMIVGKGEAASFLSRVINLKGELYDFEISPNGTQVTATPYEGETGMLNMTEEYTVNGNLVAAVVRSGDYSFNVADYREGLAVPAATYSLESGYATRGKTETVRIRNGKMGPIEVKAGAEKSVGWGSPVRIEFDYEKDGEYVTVQPDVVFYGAANEEYHTFTPNAKSPKIIIRDKRTGKEVISGRFGGC
ncbi:MAG: hypothetical protein QF724_09615 [Planctomycetota bacterium]|jgi:hypothetical protein|nr:hypothetical protein [Planctomycetota bacterium]MDP6839181.1 hypothetical protein [Planctomycetota bacterium]MDP6956677.1 hypothetical protein [Planctomycetota bacterium]